MFRKLLIALNLFVVPIEIACARQPDEVSYHDETTLPEGKTGERIESIIDTIWCRNSFVQRENAFTRPLFHQRNTAAFDESLPRHAIEINAAVQLASVDPEELPLLARQHPVV